MKKLLFGLCALACLGQSSAALADEEAQAEDKPRAPSADLGLMMVPWGMAYTRAGLGASVRYEAPLIDRPGILWKTTSFAFGVRDFYGFVNNGLSAFVEVTPIAFFKLQLSAAYDSLIVNPASGGLRVLTAVGREKLEDGTVARGDPNAVDWVEGEDNRDNFFEPVPGDGFRVKIAPTLQGKVGPVGFQYNFTADFNFYKGVGYDRDDIFSDTFTFTLRKMRDFAHFHEVVVAAEIPGIRDELRVGLIGHYMSVAGTGLSSLPLSALVFYRPRWQWLGERLSPWIAGRVGTLLVDPMHQFDFSWVLAIGLDVRLLQRPRT